MSRHRWSSLSPNAAGHLTLFVIFIVVLFTAIIVSRQSTLTLDLSASSDIVELSLAKADVSLAPHSLALEDATLCGQINPAGSTSLDCNSRTNISTHYNGRLIMSERGRVSVQLIDGGQKILLLVKEKTSAGYLEPQFEQSHQTQLPAEVLVLLSTSRKNAQPLAIPFKAAGFVVGGSGRSQSSTAPPILDSGSATIIDRGIFGELVVIGQKIEFSRGDIVKFCPELPQHKSCGEAIGIIQLSNNKILFSARVPLLQVSVSKFGTAGYNIRSPWWERVISEPIIILIWTMLGSIYFALGLRDRIVSYWETKNGIE